MNILGFILQKMYFLFTLNLLLLQQLFCNVSAHEDTLTKENEDLTFMVSVAEANFSSRAFPTGTEYASWETDEVKMELLR